MNKPLLCLVFLAAASLLSNLGHTQSAKRPMTFEDMMAMKRLGETAVSPDGQWLAYSVSTVNIEANKSTSQWYLQKIAGGGPTPLPLLQPSDSGLQFSRRWKTHYLFLSQPLRIAANLASRQL